MQAGLYTPAYCTDHYSACDYKINYRGLRIFSHRDVPEYMEISGLGKVLETESGYTISRGEAEEIMLRLLKG